MTVESVTFVGRGDQVTANSTTITATPPAGTALVDGDVKFVQLTQKNNSAITDPAGWTLIARVEQTTTHVLAVWYKRHVAGDANPTITIGSSGQMLATMSAHRGLDASTLLDVPAATASGTAASGFTSADVGDTATACARLVHFASSSGTNALRAVENANIPPFTAYGGADYDTANGSQCCVFFDRPLAHTSQIVRTQAFAEDSGSSSWATASVALRPASPTVMPVPPSMMALVRQQTPRTFGVQCSPSDTLHATRLSVQVFDPYPDEADYWDVGYWDSAGWSGVGRWRDVSDRVRGATWTVGVDAPGGRPKIGTAAVDLDNADGEASSWATAGDFADSGASWLRPGALMRIGTTYLGSGSTPTDGRELWVACFTGLVTDIVENTEQGADAWVTVNMIEPLGTLATFNGLTQAEQGGGEGFTARIFRLLTDAGWPYSYYGGTIPSYSNTATMQGTVMAGERLAEMYLTGDSAGCHVYSFPDGGVYLNTPAVSSSVLTFSNEPQGTELPLAADAVTPYANNERVLNVAIGTFVGGTQQSVSDALSISKFGRIDSGNGWPRNDLICQSEATVTSVLQAAIAARAFDDVGIESIEVDADHAPDVLYWRLGALRLFGNVTVRWVHPSGNELTFTAYVESMTHSVTMLGQQVKWVSRLGLAYLDRT